MKFKAASVNTYCILTLIIGGILFAFKVTPEQTIINFNPMTETSLKNDLRVIDT
jgi:hypothetical protein